jgi:predicted Rossmann fold flavoprotein
MIIVIGGGPAGFFGAIAAREAQPDQPVTLLEKQGAVLRKVAVSGGGRCNVTHACDNARELAAHYPRGRRELIGPLTHWSVADTVAWFASHGVRLKTERDGRMFPESDSSATIVDCLYETAVLAGVEVLTRHPVSGIALRDGGGFLVRLTDETMVECDRILLATGGHSLGRKDPDAVDGYTLAQSLGHGLAEPVPSLFTFNLDDPAWKELTGLAVDPVGLRVHGQGLPGKGLASEGPLLMTHWGVSGPAVLKLSAFGARVFHEKDYRFELAVDWLPRMDRPALEETLRLWADQNGKKAVVSGRPVPLPGRAWRTLMAKIDTPEQMKWADLGRKSFQKMVEQLKNTRLAVTGKSTFKDEFVTCGGVPLNEVDLRTMASRICPGLYLAGEVLDIDGLTGGFNFQAAWTTGRLAGQALSE